MGEPASRHAGSTRIRSRAPRQSTQRLSCAGRPGCPCAHLQRESCADQHRWSPPGVRDIALSLARGFPGSRSKDRDLWWESCVGSSSSCPTYGELLCGLVSGAVHCGEPLRGAVRWRHPQCSPAQAAQRACGSGRGGSSDADLCVWRININRFWYRCDGPRTRSSPGRSGCGLRQHGQPRIVEATGPGTTGLPRPESPPPRAEHPAPGP